MLASEKSSHHSMSDGMVHSPLLSVDSERPSANDRNNKS